MNNLILITVMGILMLREKKSINFNNLFIRPTKSYIKNSSPFETSEETVKLGTNLLSLPDIFRISP